MASEADDTVEDALTVLVSVKEKSGNLRSDLRKDILRAVSNLRKEFAKLKSEVEDKNKLIIGWEQKAVEANSMLKALQAGAGANVRGDKETTSVGLQVTTKDSDWNVTPSVGKTRKYSDVLANRRGTVSYDH